MQNRSVKLQPLNYHVCSHEPSATVHISRFNHNKHNVSTYATPPHELHQIMLRFTSCFTHDHESNRHGPNNPHNRLGSISPTAPLLPCLEHNLFTCGQECDHWWFHCITTEACAALFKSLTSISAFNSSPQKPHRTLWIFDLHHQHLV